MWRLHAPPRLKNHLLLPPLEARLARLGARLPLCRISLRLAAFLADSRGLRVDVVVERPLLALCRREPGMQIKAIDERLVGQRRCRAT